MKLGKLAQKNIIKELGENRKSEIELFQLEITDESHCQKFAEHLKEQGGIDVLINNAGFAFKVCFILKNLFITDFNFCVL